MESIIRKLVKQYMEGLQWESALFWAEMVMGLSSGNMDDTLAYLRCLIEMGHHLRALSLLEHRGLLKGHKIFQYFGAQCLLASRRYEETVQLIESPLLDGSNSDKNVSPSNRSNTTSIPATDLTTLNRYADEWKMETGLLLLLGKAYEKMENRQQAANAYKQCLLKDFSCIEAFDRLVRRHMLTETDEKDLLKRLFDQDTATTNRSMAPVYKLAKFLYHGKSSTSSFSDPSITDNTTIGNEDEELKKILGSNLSLMIGRAERLYYQSKFRDSYAWTTKILSEEEYHSDALPIHVANLVALSKTTDLYTLAHKLIDSFPDLLISWYSVACYYYSIENYEAAKRFFHKCTLMDPQHGASWIGYGHSFAVEQEHDQAMNCYVKAAKVMSSCHSPLMYVGLEYSLSNNLRLAEKFFTHASSMAPDDPYVLHELGVLFFRLENYTKAEELLSKAEKAVGSRPAWEELWNNLGHIMRKLKRYDDSLAYHRRALRLAPRNASTLAAIGYLHMFTEEFASAVEYFHQSLSLKRDDAFVTALLTKAMDILNDTWKTPFQEPPLLTVPRIQVQQELPSKEKTTRVDDTHSDVEMEEM